MKRTLAWVAAVILPITAVRASSVVTCSQNAMVANTCSAAHITDFNGNLQWNVLGPASGIPFTNQASATTTIAGVSVSVSDAGGQMVLADNYGLINRNGHWIDPAVLPTAPYRFSGHFDAPPDTAPAPGFVPVGNPGDYLVGTYQNNQSVTLSMSGSNNVGLQAFAFRIASGSLSVFDVTVSEYSGANGTGTLLGSQVFTGLQGGGNCANLFLKPPQPCNDAPWVVGSGFLGVGNRINSIVIHTSDTSGFFIDTFYVEEVPEPDTNTTALIGIGLIGVAVVVRRKSKTGSKA